MADTKQSENWHIITGFGLVGLGIGILANHAAGGLILGLGIGLLVVAFWPHLRR